MGLALPEVNPRLAHERTIIILDPCGHLCTYDRSRERLLGNQLDQEPLLRLEHLSDPAVEGRQPQAMARAQVDEVKVRDLPTRDAAR